MTGVQTCALPISAKDYLTIVDMLYMKENDEKLFPHYLKQLAMGVVEDLASSEGSYDNFNLKELNEIFSAPFSAESEENSDTTPKLMKVGDFKTPTNASIPIAECNAPKGERVREVNSPDMKIVKKKIQYAESDTEGEEEEEEKGDEEVNPIVID